MAVDPQRDIGAGVTEALGHCWNRGSLTQQLNRMGVPAASVAICLPVRLRSWRRGFWYPFCRGSSSSRRVARRSIRGWRSRRHTAHGPDSVLVCVPAKRRAQLWEMAMRRLSPDLVPLIRNPPSLVSSRLLRLRAVRSAKKSEAQCKPARGSIVNMSPVPLGPRPIKTMIT